MSHSHHSLPGGAGARISRAPFGCSGPTTPAILHALEQARRAVVADLEPALHVGDRRLALGGDDLHGLVVQRILLAALGAALSRGSPEIPASGMLGPSSTSSM